jgi:hypothetical protein
LYERFEEVMVGQGGEGDRGGGRGKGIEKAPKGNVGKQLVALARDWAQYVTPYIEVLSRITRDLSVVAT